MSWLERLVGSRSAMTVVSNASPLINLARVGKLDLLRDLYGEIIIPDAVWHEVVKDGR